MDPGGIQTNFTFLVNDSHKLNNLVCRFWNIEEPKEIQVVKPEEKPAGDTVGDTLTFDDGRYSIGLPWKSKDHELPDNFNMALRLLQNTEKRLQKSPELGKAYSDVLQTCQAKGQGFARRRETWSSLAPVPLSSSEARQVHDKDPDCI